MKTKQKTHVVLVSHAFWQPLDPYLSNFGQRSNHRIILMPNQCVASLTVARVCLYHSSTKSPRLLSKNAHADICQNIG